MKHENKKTCGECKFYCDDAAFCSHYGVGWKQKTDMVCKDFEPIPKPTNGDKIRQGGDKRLITFATEWSCFHCAYRNGIENRCKRPKDKDCFDGMLAWLNAPAESEGKNDDVR